jgi:hypothetical protein
MPADPTTDAALVVTLRLLAGAIEHEWWDNIAPTAHAEAVDQAAARIEALVAEVAELRAAAKWRPIAEAPRDGTVVLVWDGEHKIAFFGRSPKPYAFEGWTTGWETASGYDVGYSTIYPTQFCNLPRDPDAAA